MLLELGEIFESEITTNAYIIGSVVFIVLNIRSHLEYPGQYWS